MNEADALSKNLEPLGLPAWRYFPLVGSTNDVALNWAEQGAADWSLVVSDAQTAGRGRAGRQWVTVPGQSLAFSLVFRLSSAETEYFPRLTALGALGLIRALEGVGLHACLKWPNDVLLMGSKVGGVLVEANWQSGAVEAAVIGIGVNIAAGSVPPVQGLRYPATDIASTLGAPVDRWALLAQILGAMQAYRQQLTEVVFVEAWNKHLAWRGEWIRFQLPGEQPQPMRISEVMPDGQLALETRDGQKFHALSGEIIVGND